ncbi:MAG: hypothetical protein K6E20_00665 [Acholeplasmatales bacterium]|nr:hypothetical protein [Acholeplasmatales bacterium]
MLISKKTKLIIQIIIGVLMAISVFVGIMFLYFAISDKNQPYFLDHFGLFVSLTCIGVIALLLPYVANSRFMGNGKDSIMVLGGFTLIICGIIAIIYSYLNL